ncbi:MAG: HAMP domain-containing sensor histidine kinase [Gemmatimonadaceae bacterium]
MINASDTDAAARRGAFASMIAHELRTPLTAAYGALEMMSRAGVTAEPTDARTSLLLDLAHRNTHRLLRIVEDCLDLEADSDNRLILCREDIAPACVAELGIQGSRDAREQTGIQVEVRGGSARVITGDRTRLGRALTHLVQNAVSFAPPGTQASVTISDELSRGMTRFAVEDRGAGVDPRLAHELFQRFDCREAIGRRRVGGLGVGLAYVRTIAEAHDGRVGAGLEPGRTTFWFEVPSRDERTPHPG